MSSIITLEGEFARDQRVFGLRQLLFIEKPPLRGLGYRQGLGKDAKLVGVGIGHLGYPFLVPIRDRYGNEAGFFRSNLGITR
jgi:hypothetical protein